MLSLLSILLVGVAIFQIAITFLVFQLLKQRGRMLLRLDNLERRFGDLASQTPSEPARNNNKRLPGERPLSESRIERDGIKPGTSAPPFELPEVKGGRVRLETFRGRKTLLVFTSPYCSPCDALLPRITAFHRQHRDNGLSILMIGRGELSENKRKIASFGIEFPVGVQTRWEVSRQYGIFSTPVAFLIDENGVVADTVAKGAGEIMTLANEAVVRKENET